MKPANPVLVLPPFRDSAGAQLNAGLAELTARGPDAAELASLATRLSLLGLPMTLPAAPSPAVTPASSGWKWGLAAGAAVSGVALWLSLKAPVTPVAPTSAAAPASAAQLAPPAERGPSSLAPSAASARRITPKGETLALTEPAPSSAPPPAAEEPTSPRPAETSVTGPPLRSGIAEPEQTLAPGPAASPSAKPKAGSKATPQPAAAQAPSSSDASPPSELEILRGARLALKSSPSEALRLTAQHQASYPGGKLSQERELIAISALVALGRRTAALGRASSFEHSFPNSAYRKQIGELLQ